MGLGKTVQTICTLAHLAEAEGIWGPFMVIAPLSTLTNWHAEFERFTPHMRVCSSSSFRLFTLLRGTVIQFSFFIFP